MQVVGFSDTDIAEYIYARRPQLESLVKYLCKDFTKVCNKKPPPVPKVLYHSLHIGWLEPYSLRLVFSFDFFFLFSCLGENKLESFK